MKMYNNNCIIIQFPAFSGGKFIGNCLALSKHCVPMHKKHASYLIDNPTDYEYRLKCHADIMKIDGNWRDKKEFHEPELLGNEVYNAWKYGNTIDSSKFNDTTSAILNCDVNFVLVAHSVESVIRISKVWECAPVIVLTNVEKFWNLAFPLKMDELACSSDDSRNYAGNYRKSHYDSLRGDDWPTWHEFEDAVYNVDNLPNDYPLSTISEIKEFYEWHTVKNDVISFDMGSSIFSRRKFLVAIEKLYNQLCYTDYNPSLVSTYWEEYVRFHDVSKFDLS